MSEQANDAPVTCRVCQSTYVPSFFNDFYADKGKTTGRCERCVMSEAFQPSLIEGAKVETLCRFRQGKATCAFLLFDGEFKCAKGSGGINNSILDRWRKHLMEADGNYCHGPKDDYRPMTPEEIERHRNGTN